MLDALITAVYTALLAWGFGVGVRLIWQGRHRPETLLNPLFANRYALRLFTLHMAVVSADLFVIGPLALAIRSPLWYWGGRVAALSCSLPLAVYLNRNPESFGRLIGRWVVVRNVFEVGAHVAVAAAPIRWSWYYALLWWVVAYRFLDVGPRRALQKLYDTPQKLAARPWAPALNWAVIGALYLLTAWLVIGHPGRVLYAQLPAEAGPLHASRPIARALVLGLNLAVAVLSWIFTRQYTQSLLHEAARGRDPRTAAPQA
jgi:hypothetical protein